MADHTVTRFDPDHPGWTDDELAAILGRAVVDGLLANELTPERAFHKARLAGSYARRVIERKEKEAAYAMLQREGFAVIASGFGVGR